MIVNREQLQRGKAIHRRTGRTFYYATRMLPERVREQTYVLYGFFRLADEVVDGGVDRPAASKRRELLALREAALGNEPATDPVVAAFAEVRERAGIPAVEVEAFVDAMLADVDPTPYETPAELDTYMRGSAAAVGNMMLAIIGASDPELARPHAMALGEAFQLTNFIRDVREDVRELDRVYLPRQTLDRHGVTREQLERGDCTPGVRRAIQHELRRAEERYRKGVEGIRYLSADCRFPVLLAATLYAEHHRLIRANGFDVLTSRPSLPGRRKLAVMAKTWWHWRRLEDPVTVFQTVSPVPPREERSAPTEYANPTVE